MAGRGSSGSPIRETSGDSPQMTSVESPQETSGGSPRSNSELARSGSEERRNLMSRAALAVARLANRRPRTSSESPHWSGSDASASSSPRQPRATRRRMIVEGGIFIEFSEEVADEDADEDDDDDDTYTPRNDDEEEEEDEEGIERSVNETFQETARRNGQGTSACHKKFKAVNLPVSSTPPQPMGEHPLVGETLIRTSASWRAAKYAKVQGGYSGRANVFLMLEGRQQNASGLGHFSSAERCHVSQRYLPSDGPTQIDTRVSRAYIGQFAADGSIFVAAYQDKCIRLYDVENGWQLRKEVSARNLRWTITDTALTSDQRFLVYASINPVVHLVNVGSGSGRIQSLANITDIHEGLDFSMGNRQQSFGIWSLQFSADGREIVAGSSDKSLYIYDVEANKPILKVQAHDDDVNAVTFADDSSNLIFSGSDDKLCKVWDRRVLGNASKPAGVLVGHCEGITHLSSKGDSWHLISNSKDQTLKLWDIRRMHDHAAYKKLPRVRVPEFNWDYRWMDYPGRNENVVHPLDQSLMTYRGHQVLQTLIRAYFSPMHTTGQRYVYSGSNDGKIYVYDLLTGVTVAKLQHHRAPVRDCSWHPTLPMMASVSWDGELALWEHFRGGKPPSGALKFKRPETSSNSFEWDA